VLEHRGLRAAVASLTAASPVPVALDVTDTRHPEAVETAAYYLVAEALTNVVRHAGATSAAVTVAEDGDILRVEVRDDGRGGARVTEAGGLRGLEDRVTALRGRLEVSSGPGGTVLRAELPRG